MQQKQRLLVFVRCILLAAGVVGATNITTAAAELATPVTQQVNQPPSTSPPKTDAATERPGADDGKAARPQASALLAAYEESRSDADAARFVTAALEVQQDRNIAWDPQWGETIEELRRLGKIPDVQWKQYLTHAMFYRCLIRRRVRADTPISVSFYEDPSPLRSPVGWRAVRLGDGSAEFHIGFTWRVGSVALLRGETETTALKVNYHFDRPEADRSATATLGDHFWPRAPFTNHLRLYLRPTDRPHGDLWPTGHARLRIRFDLAFFEEPKGAETYSRQFEYEREIEIVDSGTSTVTLSADPGLREKVGQSIRVDTLSVSGGGKGRVSLPFYMSGDAVGLAFDVHVRQGATSWKLGSVTSSVRPGTHYRYVSAELPGVDANRPADVVFRPNACLAETTAHLYEIWGEEVVKSDIRFRIWE